jgi:hypothetical protein
MPKSVLNNLYFCGTHYDADCVVNNVDGNWWKMVWRRFQESGRGLIGAMSWQCFGGTERNHQDNNNNNNIYELQLGYHPVISVKITGEHGRDSNWDPHECEIE